jgi:hypothetical protein
MISIRLKGGMGNQMFQYALGLKMADALQTELQLDLSSLLDRSKGDFVYRDYDLCIFNVNDSFVINPSFLRTIYRPKLSIITKIIRKYLNKKNNLIKEKQFQYDEELVQDNQQNNVYEGWFQSYRYFEGIEDKVKQKFTFKTPILPYSQPLLKRISSTNAICLNVRRTDFLKVDTLNTTNKDYFLNAAKHLSELVENPHFFIFSDDVEWCRENIILDHPTEIVDHSHKGERFGNYMQLMKACKHYIIPNSSFAWWAVWLNENPKKYVVAPKKWFNDDTINTSDLVPKEWIRM